MPLTMSYTVSAASAHAVSASISTPVRCSAWTSLVSSISPRSRSTSALTSTELSGSWCASGISSSVRLAAMMPATRAVPSTSPFGASPAFTASAVSRETRTVARACGATAHLLSTHVHHPRLPLRVEVREPSLRAGERRGAGRRYPRHFARGAVRALLALPQRRLALDAVDDRPCTRKGFGAMRRRDRDDHARLPERDGPHAVLGRGRAEVMCARALRHDQRDPLARHLRVRLVVQARHLACHPLEDHECARAPVAHLRGYRLDVERLLAHRAVQARAP